MRREALPEIDSVALLRAILSELKGLRADLAQRQPPEVSGGPAKDAEFLQEIFALVGSEPFAAFELVEELGGVNAQQLGQRLSYLQGRTLAGLQVRKVGRAGYGTLWTIEPVAG